MQCKNFSFSAKTPQDIELIEQLKAKCAREKKVFSQILIDLVRSGLDEQHRNKRESR